MEKLLPDQLQTLWHAVEQKQLTTEAFTSEQDRLLGEYQQTWKQALLLNGFQDLPESLLSELSVYMRCDDVAEIRRRCAQAVAALKSEWQEQVRAADWQAAVEHYYDQSQTLLYELMWWHTLSEEASPLAYVTALHFAQQHGCKRYLDFGAGVGSGGMLFAAHGFDVTLADISSTLLRFSQWRLEQRGYSSTYIDLKTHDLSPHAYDFVTAMDVFEHLVEPVVTAEQIYSALRPGGFLYARLAAEVDEDRPQHIVQDFGPTFDRMRELGLVQVWQDKWLWGHQVFQKR